MGWLRDRWEDFEESIPSTLGAVGGFMVGGPMGAAAGYGIGKSIEGSEDVAEEIGKSAEGVERTAARAEALNIERFGEAKELLSPYIEQTGTAREQLMVEMGLSPGEAGAYMQAPGYQAMLEERQAGVEQASASGGELYSGRRMKAAADVSGATQSQFYTNYMNILQNMGSPAVATNLASLGVGQGATMGQQQMQAQQVASDYRIGGKQAEQAMWGDLVGMGANIYGGYMAGGGGGGGGYTTDYSIPMTSTDYPGYI